MSNTEPNAHKDDAEWGDILSAWRDNDENEDAPVLPEQEVEMVKSTRTLKLKLLGEFAAGAFVMAFYAVFLQYNSSVFTVALAAASVMLLAVYLTVMTGLFLRVLKPRAHTTSAYLAIVGKRLEAHVQWSGFIQLSSVGFGVFMAFWTVWFISSNDDPSKTALAIALPLLGVYAILAGVIYFARKKFHADRQSLQALRSASESSTHPQRRPFD